MCLAFPVIADNLSTPLAPCILDCTWCVDGEKEGFEFTILDCDVSVFTVDEFDWVPPKWMISLEDYNFVIIFNDTIGKSNE